MPELDARLLPLTGRSLVEASAGTGKTHAIGSLVLRVLLGDGRRRQGIEEILVVTFTNAATMELKTRIRARIADALSAFTDAEAWRRAHADAGDPADPVVEALLERCTPAETARAILRAALARFDEAAVFTIHAFCQRILVERAFDSGAIFERELVLDDAPYVEQAVRDFWRRRIYPLAADEAALVHEVFSSPAALQKSLSDYLGREAIALRGVDERDFDALRDAAREALGAVKRHWTSAGLRHRIEASSVKGGASNTRGGGSAQLDAMDAWAGTDEHVLAVRGDDDALGSVAALLREYTKARLTAPSNLNKTGADPDFDDLFERVDAALASVGALTARLRVDALDEVCSAAREARLADHRVSPDDVLRETATRLRGPGGERFAAGVRRALPVAFIDEFQDTDPVQYAIFDALYPDDGETDDHALVMIGDPKQAIYAFRGADVFAYLDARDALPAGRRFEMDRNWRSTPEMLEAVAALYEGADDPFATPEIAFIDVSARPDAQRGTLTRGGEPMPALHFWHLPSADKGIVSGGALRTRMTQQLVARVQGLLREDVKLAGRALVPGDIAVLVRSHHEAAQVHGALAEAGIASVRVSRDPVFVTEVATDLLEILRAVAEPRDEGRVRAALATPLLQLPLDELRHTFRDDEAGWQAQLDRFARYHELWRNQGALVMLRALLEDHDVPRRRLATPDGPRVLTDLRHLGELLQQSSAELGSVHRVLRWFARQRQDGAGTEEARMRLESDERLVRIVTQHVAKGLEYEFVMLPFTTAPRDAEDASFHERRDGRWLSVLDLAPDDAARGKAERERLAEDLRLLYVALTRARRACFVGVANPGEKGRPPSAFRRTGLGHLLLGAGAPPKDAEIVDRLSALAASSEQIVVETVSDASTTTDVHDFRPELARRTPFVGRIADDWRMTSYSALVDVGDRAAPWQRGAADEGHAPSVEPERPAGDADIAFRFPKGARPGSCLHEALEDWPDDEGEARAHVARALQRWGLSGADAEPEAVFRWLRQVRECALPFGASLATAHAAFAEMEFHLPLDGLDCARLRSLLAEFGYDDGPLAVSTVTGLLRGFVDLVVEHEGRFWIVDYKSNWLGARADAYEPEALAESVREHRYDLQYLLYAVALRRLLALRLGEHGPSRFGGVLYLYLRGLDGSGRRGIHEDQPPVALLDAMDAAFRGARA